MAFQHILLFILRNVLQVKHWLFQLILLQPAEQSGAFSAYTPHAHITHFVPWSHTCHLTILIWTYKKYFKALPWSHNVAWFITLGVQTNTNSIQVLSKNLLNTITKSRPRLSTCTSRSLLWSMWIQRRYCITFPPFEYITNWFPLAEFPGLGYPIPLMKAS